MPYLDARDRARIKKLEPAIQQMEPRLAVDLYNDLQRLHEAYEKADDIYDLLRPYIYEDPEKAIEQYCAALSPENRTELEAFLTNLHTLADELFSKTIKFTLAAAVCEKLSVIAIDVWNDAQAKAHDEEEEHVSD